MQLFCTIFYYYFEIEKLYVTFCTKGMNIWNTNCMQIFAQKSMIILNTEVVFIFFHKKVLIFESEKLYLTFSTKNLWMFETEIVCTFFPQTSMSMQLFCTIFLFE